MGGRNLGADVVFLDVKDEKESKSPGNIGF
jgi:hypothetical protein